MIDPFSWVHWIEQAETMVEAYVWALWHLGEPETNR